VDSKGNSYILAIIDTFSRFIMLYPIPDTKGEDAARVLLSFIAIFGCPDQITSDQGKQFVNQIVQDLLILLLGTEHVTSIAYSHEENAIVERSHKETMRHLRALMFDRQLAEHWSDCLPLVQRIMNAKVHETTGFTPSRLLFGDAINLDQNIFVPEETSEPSGVPRMLSTYMQNLLVAQDKIRDLAQEQIKKRDETNLAKRSNPFPTVFDINSWVLYAGEGSITAKRDKTNTPKAGPFKVVSRNELDNSYTILDTVQNVEKVVHISKLSPFVYDPRYTNPYDIARQDSEEFMVKAILDHKPHLSRGAERPKSSQLEFLVRWDNYPTLADSWEPFKLLRNNTLLHTYLLANKMKSYIPQGVKFIQSRPKTHKTSHSPKLRGRPNLATIPKKRGRPKKNV
jgi:hypothetical protein